MSADRCPCGDRERSQCPGEWEPGCDLGNNPAHVAVAKPSADRWVRVPRSVVQACIDHLPYRSAIIPELTAALAAAPAAPEPHIDGWPLYSGLPPAAPAAEAVEFETRADGQRVRVDRWEVAIRRIVALLWGNRREFECDEVVEAVRALVPCPHGEGDDEALVNAVLAAPGAATAQSREPLTEEQVEAAMNPCDDSDMGRHLRREFIASFKRVYARLHDFGRQP